MHERDIGGIHPWFINYDVKFHILFAILRIIIMHSPMYWQAQYPCSGRHSAHAVACRHSAHAVAGTVPMQW